MNAINVNARVKLIANGKNKKETRIQGNKQIIINLNHLFPLSNSSLHKFANKNPTGTAKAKTTI
jgi:hypothetical protein